MPIAVLLSFVAMSLGALLASMVANSAVVTRADLRQVQTVTATQSGLDVAMAQILAAPALAALPCSVPAAVAGEVAFTVQITYYADTGATSCPPTSVPRSARLSVTSSGGKGANRTVTATYAFPSTSAGEPPGGRIQLYGDPPLCVTAARPAAPGARLQVLACGPELPEQTFVYLPDLTVALAAADPAQRLCLDAGAGTAGVAVTLQTCASAVLRQQWRYTGFRNFGTELGGGRCLNAVAGVLQLGNSCGRGPDRTQTWLPEPDVGVGAAGAAGGLVAGASAGQLVNNADFASCLSLVAPSAGTGLPLLGVLPCSQSQASWVVPISELWKAVPAVAGQPDADKVLTATGVAGPLCLTAPTAGALPAPVTAQPCDPGTGSPTTAQRWTVRGLADTPAQSYRIEDQASPPRCLATSALALAPFVVRAVLAPCDASPGQKWNALPSAFRPQLRDVHED